MLSITTDHYCTQISTNVGKLVIPASFRHYFHVECWEAEIRVWRRKRFSELARYPACRVSTVPESYPSYAVTKFVLANVKYTAPALYEGEVELQVVVEDFGFSGGVNSGFGERGLRLDDEPHVYSHADSGKPLLPASGPLALREARESKTVSVAFSGYVARENLAPVVRLE